jgi:hypothetical protein
MLGLDKEVCGVAALPTDERVAGLKRIIPRKTVQLILNRTHPNQRFCKRLPRVFVVWFIIGLALHSSDSYTQVFRWLHGRKTPVPGASTLCEARHSVGVAPLRHLTEEIVQLLATPEETPNAFYCGMRLMAIDGFVLDLPDRPELARIFGRPQSGRAEGAFPQARVLALCEAGTHVIWKHQIKPIGCGETTMAPCLIRHLQPGMLLLWDRGFFSYALLKQVLATGVHLLARLKKNLIFKVIRRYCDGSYLAKAYRSSADRNKDRGGIKVRIIEYRLNDPGRPGSEERHRLMTTLLSPTQHPAKTLIELYHQRWEIEITIDEVKTHLRERPVLRSETPAGVIQEIEGLLLAHYVVRALMVEVAKKEGIDPRRLSFTGTLKILRCRMAECPKDAHGQREWYEDLLGEIATTKLPPRRDRINPRVIKRKMSKWAKKRPAHRNYPQPKKKFRQSIEMLD